MVNGWERVDYIKPAPDFHPTLSFNFDETFDIVAAEVKNLQKNVGLAEVNGFNRLEITGADRHAFLDRMMCGAVTKRDGRVGLGYLLNHHGMVKAEATIANLPASDRGPARVWYGSAAASEYHDMDWLQMHLRDDEDVQICSLTNDQTILVLAGLKSRDVLSACARGDWSREAFPWLSVRECFIGFAPATVLKHQLLGGTGLRSPCPKCLALRGVSGSAKGRREPWHETVWRPRCRIHADGERVPALESRSSHRILDPFETGLDRFVKLNKGDFIGQDSLAKRCEIGPNKKLVSLKIDTTKAPAHGGASLMLGGKVVGTITSGDWGHRTGLNLAYGFVNPDASKPGSKMQLDLCGELIDAEVIAPSPYDPDLTRVRS